MKVKIHFFTFLLWVIAYFNGSLKAITFLFMMMTLHELAHCATATLFHLNISKFSWYPFGLCAQIEKLEYQRWYIQILVVASGPCMHLLIPLILNILRSYHLLSPVFYDWCMMMNFQILIFNCLPIYPLDGSRIIQAFLFVLFPYKVSKISLYVLSIIVSIYCGFYWITLSVSSIVIFSLLLIMNVLFLVKLKKEFEQVIFYRLVHYTNFKSIVHHFNDLYLYRTNMYKYGEDIIDEKAGLLRILKQEYQ